MLRRLGASIVCAMVLTTLFSWTPRIDPSQAGIGLAATQAKPQGAGNFTLLLLGGFDDPGRLATAEIQRFSLFVLSPYMNQLATKIRTANPDALIYMYKDSSSIRLDPTDSTPSPEWCSPSTEAIGMSWGVEYCDADQNHPNWFLTYNGNRFEYDTYAHHWHADVGAAGYKEKWVSNVIANLNANPAWDGVWVDNQLVFINDYTPGAGTTGDYPDQYATAASGQAAYDTFIDYVGQQVRSAGHDAVANMSNARLVSGIWDDYSENLSGGFDEFWTTFGIIDGKPSNLPAYGVEGWQAQLAEVDSNVALGKFAIVSAQTNATCAVCAVYGYASYLLVNDGNQFYIESNGDVTFNSWVHARPMYSWDLGTAQSGRVEIQGVGSSLFQRDFDKGRVIVNASGTTDRTVDLGGTYLDAEGQQVTSVSVPRETAVILRDADWVQPATSAPEAPTDFKATGVSGRSVELSWDAAAGARHYNVWRGDANWQNWARVAQPTGTTYTDNTAISGETYRYQVRTENWAGQISAPSSTVTVTALDPVTPVPPGNVRQTGVSSTSVALAWDSIAGARHYNVWRADANWQNWIQLSQPAGTTFTDNTVTAGETYRYQVRTENWVGQISGPSTTVTVTATNEATSLTPPTNFRTTSVTGSSVGLAWDGTAGARHYNVWRADANWQNWIRLTQTTGTAYVDNAVTSGQTYRYQIRTENWSGQISDPANTLTVTATSEPLVPLVAPANFRTTSVSTNSVGLVWDETVGAQHYNVWRADANWQNWVRLAQPTGTTYTDNSVAAGVTYRYQVRAENAVGEISPQSTTLTVTPA